MVQGTPRLRGTKWHPKKEPQTSKKRIGEGLITSGNSVLSVKTHDYIPQTHRVISIVKY